MHSAQLEISASRVVRHRDRPNHIVTATSKPRDSSLLWRICRVSLHSLVMFGSLTWVHISSSSPTRPIMRSTCLHGPIITQSIAHPGEVATGICSVAGRLTTLIHLERSCAKLQAQLTVKYDSVQLPEPPPGGSAPGRRWGFRLQTSVISPTDNIWLRPWTAKRCILLAFVPRARCPCIIKFLYPSNPLST